MAAPAKTQRYSLSSGSMRTLAWKMKVAPRWAVEKTGPHRDECNKDQAMAQWYMAVHSISLMCTAKMLHTLKRSRTPFGL